LSWSASVGGFHQMVLRAKLSSSWESGLEFILSQHTTDSRLLKLQNADLGGHEALKFTR
jgi:hypothetical protein